jgi:thiol:disulfide interchange protein DsbC
MKKILFALMLALFAAPGALFAGDLPQNRDEDAKRIDVSKLPLQDAITIKRGNGAKKLILFTDVDCPYSKKAHDWLKTQTNYTLYVFLLPLENIHHHSHEKSVQILCSKNQKTALDDAFRNFRKEIRSQKCEAGEKMLARHKAVAKRLGLGATPRFITETGVKISGWGERGEPRPELKSYLKN